MLLNVMLAAPSLVKLPVPETTPTTKSLPTTLVLKVALPVRVTLPALTSWLLMAPRKVKAAVLVTALLKKVSWLRKTVAALLRLP